MSNTQKIDIKYLPDMLMHVSNCMQDIRNGSKYALFIAILLLFEYCICYAYFAVRPDATSTDKGCNLRDLKRLFMDDYNEERNCCINKFSAVRNNIAHSSKRIYQSNELMLLLTDKYFETVLRKCKVPEEIIFTVTMYYDLYPVNNVVDYLRYLDSDFAKTIPSNLITNTLTRKDCLALIAQYSQNK